MLERPTAAILQVSAWETLVLDMRIQYAFKNIKEEFKDVEHVLLHIAAQMFESIAAKPALVMHRDIQRSSNHTIKSRGLNRGLALIFSEHPSSTINAVLPVPGTRDVEGGIVL